MSFQKNRNVSAWHNCCFLSLAPYHMECKFTLHVQFCFFILCQCARFCAAASSTVYVWSRGLCFRVFFSICSLALDKYRVWKNCFDKKCKIYQTATIISNNKTQIIWLYCRLRMISVCNKYLVFLISGWKEKLFYMFGLTSAKLLIKNLNL